MLHRKWPPVSIRRYPLPLLSATDIPAKPPTVDSMTTHRPSDENWYQDRSVSGVGLIRVRPLPFAFAM